MIILLSFNSQESGAPFLAYPPKKFQNGQKIPLPKIKFFLKYSLIICEKIEFLFKV